MDYYVPNMPTKVFSLLIFFLFLKQKVNKVSSEM